MEKTKILRYIETIGEITHIRWFEVTQKEAWALQEVALLSSPKYTIFPASFYEGTWGKTLTQVVELRNESSWMPLEYTDIQITELSEETKLKLKERTLKEKDIGLEMFAL